MIGRAGLHYWPDGMLELGYVIAREAQRKGHAREASEAWLDSPADTPTGAGRAHAFRPPQAPG